jgi:hypothetical protein
MAKKAKEKAPAPNPYKEGSRKAAIYDAFIEAGGGEGGLKVAYKRAEKLGIKAGTVKSWASGWLKGVLRPEKKETTATKPKVVHDKGYHPDFKYTSRAMADKQHEALCTRAGLRAHAFHVIEDDGRFAVAPAHYKPGGPVPTFERGDIVYDAVIANSKAKVLEAGPEQTLVRYVKERKTGPREECVINRFLIKLPEKASKRERL